MFFPVSTAELRVFPVSTTELGDNKYIPHRIDTGATQLVHKRPYRFINLWQKKKEIERQVPDLETSSPTWA